MMLSVRLHVFKRPFWGITNPGRLVLAMALLIMILAMTACNSGGGGGSPELPDNDDSNDQETYSLSGMVKAAENTAVDSDVNDVNAFFISNDNAQTAQTIFAPVSLGGYVNKPETGPAGRSYQQGDENDIFLVNLLAGDAIILSIGEPYNPFTSGPDLDLGLYDAASYDAASIELLDQSVSLSSRTETLLAPADGTYLIQVYAASGASNYTLTIGQQSTAGQNPKGLRLSGSFVPNQAVVTHKSSMDSDVKNNSDPQLSASEKAISKSHGREQLIELGQVTDDLGSLKTNHFDSYESIDFPMLINGSYIDPQKRIKLATLLAIKKLEARQDIKIAEPNYLRVANLIPDDPYYELQWHYPLIHLPEAWQITQGSADVFVGVIDSGILHEHPDLSTRVSNDGYDFVSDPTRAMDGDGIDPDPEDPGDGTQGGSLFHGTHVTGTIAAATGNGKGIAGVAGHTSILALRALGRESSGTSYDILQAVRYAAGLENDSGKIPQQPADIINLSFGGQSFSRTEQDIYSRVRSMGIILVASAGNNGENAPFYPAAYEGVVGVSAVDINAEQAPYSNYGSFIDVAAPGGSTAADLNADGYADGVLSTCGDDSSGEIRHVYSFLQGTSMAAPHVSGVAALMKALRPAMNPAEFDNFLQSRAIVRDLGAPGRDDIFGHGLIDAQKAVLTAMDGDIATLIDVSPVRLGLGTSAGSASLTVSRTGTGQINVTNVFSDASWLTIQASDIDEKGFGIYEAIADRQGLSEGNYNAVITFVSTSNTIEVPVNMRVSSINTNPDAGFHYILLVDHETGQTVKQVSASGQNGLYQYDFTGVEPGEYRIYAGTDLNNDDLLGDAGEAFGAYLSTDQPRVITADRDQTGLDFITEFRVNITQDAASDEVLLKNTHQTIKRLKNNNPKKTDQK